MRNGAVEFYRFIFSLVICLYHFRTFSSADVPPFESGYLCTEFFFLLSGFFLCAKFAENKKLGCKNIYIDLYKRFNRLYPHYFFTVICIAILRIAIIKNLTFERWLREGLGELFIFQILGAGKVLSAALWFPGALLFSTFAVHILLALFWKSEAKLLLLYFVPVAIIFKLINSNGTLNVIYGCDFLFTDGFWRAFADVLVGCACYETSTYLKGKFDSINASVFAIFEVFLVLLIIRNCYGDKYLEKNYIVLLLEVVFLVVIMSQKSKLSELLDNSVSRYLGKITYAIFLNHIIFYQAIFEFVSPIHGFKKIAALYLVVVVLVSCLTTYANDLLNKKVLAKFVSEKHGRIYVS